MHLTTLKIFCFMKYVGQSMVMDRISLLWFLQSCFSVASEVSFLRQVLSQNSEINLDNNMGITVAENSNPKSKA